MRLFLGNLSFQATEDNIAGFFGQAGITPESVMVMRDKMSGKSRGFGFVEIKEDTAATAAIQACNGRDLLGRAMVVNEARPSMSGGRGGDRGGGDRGGYGGDRGGRGRY